MALVYHTFPPVFDAQSKRLILGSFPSVKSREEGFYYMHPRNRFWALLAELYEEPLPETVWARKQFLRNHHIALWDVLACCEIDGSADSTITAPVPNDIDKILAQAPVNQIFTNGKKAEELYKKYLQKQTGISAICLPSTSPANAAFSIERLKMDWRKILQKKPFSYLQTKKNLV